MKLLLPLAAGLTALAAAAAADEFTDTLEGALEAYRSGDISAAQQDLEYAGKLLTAMKSESLAKFLPAAPAGWKREEPTDEARDPWGNLRIGASATTKLNRKDWGLVWNQVLETGGVMVGNEVKITLDLQAIKIPQRHDEIAGTEPFAPAPGGITGHRAGDLKGRITSKSCKSSSRGSVLANVQANG